MTDNLDTSYRAEIIRALEQLGGAASLAEINEQIYNNGTMPYIETNANWRDNVRATIQRHCKSTRSYRGAEDLFYSVYGLGEGYWGLKAQIENVELSNINPIEQRQINKIVSNQSLSPTEKEAIILSRRGQGEFRKRIIEKYKFCVVTGISDRRLLIASHIKPWRSATNIERLSSENGLLLSPLYDKLFDLGLITFNSSGCIITSSKLSDEDKSRIHIDNTCCYVKNMSEKIRENMEYHNDIIFIR